jgi:hypothetical protein
MVARPRCVPTLGVDGRRRVYGRSVHTRSLLVASSVVVLLAWGTPASAHTGETVYSGTAGPYLVIVTGDTVNQDGEEGILYTVALHDNEIARPVVDASVVVTATADDGTEVGPIDARPQGNTYAVFLADEGKTRWDVRIDIEGEAGEAVVTHEMHGLAVGVDEDQGSGLAWLPWAIAAVVLVLVGLVWRRTRSTPVAA